MQTFQSTTTGVSSTVSNAAFLDAVADGQRLIFHITDFVVSPNDQSAAWSGRNYTNGDDRPLRDAASSNTYFSTSSLRDDGRRVEANFERLLVLVADDADVNALQAPPSYVIRTSTNKVQVGYLLHDTPSARNYAYCKNVMAALKDRGVVGQDKNGNNPVRWVRMPVGTNTKYPDRPVHVLEVWEPDRRYTVDQALAGFGVDSVSPAVFGTADTTAGLSEADSDEWVDNTPCRLDVAQAEEQVLTGESLHGPLASLAAHHASKGLDADTTCRNLSELLDRSAAKDKLGNERADRWKAEVAKLRDDTVASAFKKFGNNYSKKEDFTDTGNVNVLARLTAGNLRYVTERKQWIEWSRGRWETDTTRGRSLVAVGRVAAHYSGQVAMLTAQLSGMDRDAAKRHQKTIDAVASWEKACRGRRGIENTLALASIHPAFAIPEAELDTDPSLFGVQNGVVDLRTGELRPGAREDYVTRRCAHAYRANAVAPRWMKFIHEVTGYPIEATVGTDGEVVPGTVGRYTPRPAYADYLQRALGYSCSGTTAEHKMFTVFGEHGSNGKNVLFDTVKSVLGANAVTASNKLLLTRRVDKDADSNTPALLALRGTRLAVSSEPPAGSAFDVEFLKALTGETEMQGRGMQKEAAPIAVTFHIWLLCNAKPKVEHLEQAVIGRILMLPFDRRWNRPGTAEHDPALPDPDKHLLNALRVEGEGILAWLVQGAVSYFANGLVLCDEVAQATRVYFAAQRVDPVAQWVSEATTKCHTSIGVQAKDAFNAFNAWRVGQESAGSLEGGVAPSNSTAFGVAMRRLGLQAVLHNVRRHPVRLLDEFAEISEVEGVPDWMRELA